MIKVQKLYFHFVLLCFPVIGIVYITESGDVLCKRLKFFVQNFLFHFCPSSATHGETHYEMQTGL